MTNFLINARNIATDIRESREDIIMDRPGSALSTSDRDMLSMSIRIARCIEARLPMELRRDFLNECGLTGAVVSRDAVR